MDVGEFSNFYVWTVRNETLWIRSNLSDNLIAMELVMYS